VANLFLETGLVEITYEEQTRASDALTVNLFHENWFSTASNLDFSIVGGHIFIRG
jgi:hypothetical protein